MVTNTRLALGLVVMSLWFPLDAAAYIDPHAGGALFQLLAPIVSLVIAGWFTMRRWLGARLRGLWQRLRGHAPK